jgi:hypothetical protein
VDLLKKLFRRKHSTRTHFLEMRNFMRVIAGPVDELFQFPDEATAKRAKEAYRNGDFFRFSTLKGRDCLVNFRQVQAVNSFVMPEVASSSCELKDVMVYLTNSPSFLEISAGILERGRFLDSLESDDLIVTLSSWQFDKHEIVIAVANGAT